MLLVILLLIVLMLRTRNYLLRTAIAGVLLLSVVGTVAAVVFGILPLPIFGGRPMEANRAEQWEDTSRYAYDIGQPKAYASAADFEIFYEMVKGNPELWQHAESFVAAETDVKTLVSQYLFEGDLGSGLFQSCFDFSSKYVEDPYNSADTAVNGGEPWQICRYNAVDVDWALKAVFDVDPVHFSRGAISDGYYEDDYYFRRVAELYMGRGRTFVEAFDASYEEAEDGAYRIRVNITTRWEYNDEPPVDYVWEFEAVPMESRDMGTYWRILSFTQK